MWFATSHYTSNSHHVLHVFQQQRHVWWRITLRLMIVFASESTGNNHSTVMHTHKSNTRAGAWHEQTFITLRAMLGGCSSLHQSSTSRAAAACLGSGYRASRGRHCSRNWGVLQCNYRHVMSSSWPGREYDSSRSSRSSSSCSSSADIHFKFHFEDRTCFALH